MATVEGLPTPESSSIVPYKEPPKKRRKTKRRFSDANYLVRDYLLAETNNQKEHYLDKLTAYCYRASGNLYILPKFPEQPRRHLSQVKRAFIQEEILKYLARYWREYCTPLEVEQLAAIGEFRYLARHVKLRMIDYIRKWYRWKKKGEISSRFL